MINGKKERFEKILIVRHKNIKLHKGRKAVYICMIVLYFLFDIASLSGIAQGGTLFPIIFSVLKALTLGIIALCLCSSLFGGDRHNNQVGIEQRSGYDNFDIFMSRFIEVVIAYAIIFVIFLIINVALYAGLKNGKMTRPFFGNAMGLDLDKQKEFVITVGGMSKDGQNITPGFGQVIDFLIVDLWWGLITFIIVSGIVIGCSYIMPTGACVAMGLVFGFALSIVIMLASVGAFSADGIGSYIPGFGHYRFGLRGDKNALLDYVQHNPNKRFQVLPTKGLEKIK